jgi:murein DD-endopeptidase MepM/ murein hydrolase activator NlpD
MKTRRFLAIAFFLLAALALRLPFAAQASGTAQLQQYASPTPGPDGRILYTVQPGDNCISVSLLNGITLEQLRALNSNLDENCSLRVGQELLLGLGGPAAASPTSGPSPTPTPIPPTPTPFTGTTEICVLIFEDQNGDALHQELEPGIEAGAVSVSNSAGTFSQSKTTTSAPDPDTGLAASVCFNDVPEGTYTISAGVPDGYNPTMLPTYTLEVKAGDRAAVAFGAQSRLQTVEQPGAEPGSRSTLMGILGAVFLLGGLGLGWYALRMRRPGNKLMR